MDNLQLTNTRKLSFWVKGVSQNDINSEINKLKNNGLSKLFLNYQF